MSKVRGIIRDPEGFSVSLCYSVCVYATGDVGFSDRKMGSRGLASITCDRISDDS